MSRGTKQPKGPVNRQQRRAQTREALKVKLPDDRKPPSIIIMMFGMVAVLAVIMIARTCYFEEKDPSALSTEEQQEYVTSYGEELAAALEEWRAERGDGLTYPADPVDAYRYMDDRPVNPFTGSYAIKAWFRPDADPTPGLTDPDDPDSEPLLDEETGEPVMVEELADHFGNYTYNLATATPADGEPIEHGGYYLMVYGDATEPGADVNMDGRPDRIVGFWVSADAASGEVLLEPLKAVLEAEFVACEEQAVDPAGNELQAQINAHYLAGVVHKQAPAEQAESAEPAEQAGDQE